VGRLGSGVRDSASFQNNPRFVGRLGSRPASWVVVGWIVRVRHFPNFLRNKLISRVAIYLLTDSFRRHSVASNAICSPICPLRRFIKSGLAVCLYCISAVQWCVKITPLNRKLDGSIWNIESTCCFWTVLEFHVVVVTAHFHISSATTFHSLFVSEFLLFLLKCVFKQTWHVRLSATASRPL